MEWKITFTRFPPPDPGRGRRHRTDHRPAGQIGQLRDHRGGQSAARARLAGAPATIILRPPSTQPSGAEIGTWYTSRATTPSSLPWPCWRRGRRGSPTWSPFTAGATLPGCAIRCAGVQRRLLRPLLARAEWLVAIARFEIALYGGELNIPESKFVLIPNGADLPSRTARFRNPAGRHIDRLGGQAERYKGHQRMIAALPHLIEMIPDRAPVDCRHQALTSSSCGAWPAAMVWKSGWTFMPFRPPTARRWRVNYPPPALVVLFSEYETHPLAVLEALSLGRPALVADTSGLSELARTGPGARHPARQLSPPGGRGGRRTNAPPAQAGQNAPANLG